LQAGVLPLNSLDGGLSWIYLSSLLDFFNLYWMLSLAPIMELFFFLMISIIINYMIIIFFNQQFMIPFIYIHYLNYILLNTIFQWSLIFGFLKSMKEIMCKTYLYSCHLHVQTNHFYSFNCYFYSNLMGFFYMYSDFCLFYSLFYLNY
jgi:hypothetical protein